MPQWVRLNSSNTYQIADKKKGPEAGYGGLGEGWPDYITEWKYRELVQHRCNLSISRGVDLFLVQNCSSHGSCHFHVVLLLLLLLLLPSILQLYSVFDSDSSGKRVAASRLALYIAQGDFRVICDRSRG